MARKAEEPSAETPEPIPELDPEGEGEKLRRYRYRSARRAGLGRIESNLFAVGDIPVAQLRACVKGGCPPELIALICI